MLTIRTLSLRPEVGEKFAVPDNRIVQRAPGEFRGRFACGDHDETRSGWNPVPQLIELVRPADLIALAGRWVSVDFAAKLEEAAEAPSTMPVRFTDEPSNPHARKNFYRRLMEERPDRPDYHARRKEAQYRQARRRE